jgi:hypothetical protein
VDFGTLTLRICILPYYFFSLILISCTANIKASRIQQNPPWQQESLTISLGNLAAEAAASSRSAAGGRGGFRGKCCDEAPQNMCGYHFLKYASNSLDKLRYSSASIRLSMPKPPVLSLFLLSGFFMVSYDRIPISKLLRICAS